MKRVLFLVIILSVLFTAACANQKLTKSDNETDQTLTESLQLVLSYDSNDFEGEADAEARDQRLRDTICLASTLEKEQKELLIKEYLQKMKTYKETPDFESSENGKHFMDYYLDEAKGKMSFVFYFYGDNFESQTEEPNASQERIICTTMNLSDFQKIGYVSYTCDNQQRTNHESLLDTKKNRIATVDYQYLNNIPFPFITKYEETGNYKDMIDDILNINQKFWLYKDYAEFDNTGKWTGYADDIYNNNDSGYDFACSYDAKGNLVKISGEMNGKPNVLNEVNIDYQKNGFLDTVVYTRPDIIYGTTDSSGEIHYDDKGRMIYQENYITHGNQYAVYLYRGEDKRPWASIRLDSEVWGHIAEGVDYGNQVKAYLFQPS
ncbi:hypothetical protein Ami103574_05445 [Aminipila butyrica]|uniref:Uncharacterized protein n=1 Tax=Aminipila butyrica TaxID=433296 RepID=A0A858BTA7_9FIRM|nr:hypothetical protein [Aminipila butyrica]QIB68797.1 hypothetical protein Ami103574_05445 [Aminipila butyrica]